MSYQYQGVLKSFQEREGVLISRETLDGASIGGGKTQTLAKTTLLADPLHFSLLTNRHCCMTDGT